MITKLPHAFTFVLAIGCAFAVTPASSHEMTRESLAQLQQAIQLAKKQDHQGVIAVTDPMLEDGVRELAVDCNSSIKVFPGNYVAYHLRSHAHNQ